MANLLHKEVRQLGSDTSQPVLLSPSLRKSTPLPVVLRGLGKLRVSNSLPNQRPSLPKLLDTGK